MEELVLYSPLLAFAFIYIECNFDVTNLNLYSFVQYIYDRAKPPPLCCNIFRKNQFYQISFFLNVRLLKIPCLNCRHCNQLKFNSMPFQNDIFHQIYKYLGR